MRHRALNLLTCSVMLALLAGLTVPAMSILRRPPPLGLPSGTHVQRSTVGVVVDPWHADGPAPVELGTWYPWTRDTLDYRAAWYGIGDRNWSVQRYPAAAAVLRQIAADGLARP
jgi:hypothetical protein